MAESTKDLKNKAEDMSEVENKDKGSLEKLALERIEALQNEVKELKKTINSFSLFENQIKLLQGSADDNIKAIKAIHENYTKLDKCSEDSRELINKHTERLIDFDDRVNYIESKLKTNEPIEVEYIKECFGVKVGTKTKLLKNDAINMEKKGYIKIC